MSGLKTTKQIADWPGGKAVSLSVLDVDNVEGSRMPLPVGDGTHTPQVTTTSDHAQVTCTTQLSLSVHKNGGFKV